MMSCRFGELGGSWVTLLNPVFQGGQLFARLGQRIDPETATALDLKETVPIAEQQSGNRRDLETSRGSAGPGSVQDFFNV